MRRFFCAWMDVGGVHVYVAVIRGGCAVYPVPAFTKTTGLITNPHRVLGSRNRGSEQLCLMPAGLDPSGRLCLRPPPHIPLRSIRLF